MRREVPKEWIRCEADERAVSEGCWFDIKRGLYVVKFLEKYTCHVEGSWAGRPFLLHDTQKNDIVVPLFSWVKPDGYRRFTKAYIFQGKKNGKTLFISALAEYFLISDFDWVLKRPEPAAKVFSLANCKGQAGWVYQNISGFMDHIPVLGETFLERVDSRKTIRNKLDSNSFYQALSNESKGADGVSASAVIFDELWGYDTPEKRNLYDVMQGSGKARKQPMQMVISYAGKASDSACFEAYQTAKQYQDSSNPAIPTNVFGRVYAAKPGCDIDDEKEWYEANPLLGVVQSIDTFRQEVAEAKMYAARLRDFRRKSLNQWLYDNIEDGWIAADVWAKGATPIDPEFLRGRPCWGGMDLGANKSLSCLSLCFPVAETDGEGGPFMLDDATMFYVLMFAFMPEADLAEREVVDRIPYREYIQKGLIETTPGAVVRNSVIVEKLRDLKTLYDVRKVAYDPWKAGEVAEDIAEELGIEVEKFGQERKIMCPANERFAIKCLQGQIQHGGNPLLTTMNRYVRMEIDERENPLIKKNKQTSRIDGIISTVIAVDVCQSSNLTAASEGIVWA